MNASTTPIIPLEASAFRQELHSKELLRLRLMGHGIPPARNTGRSLPSSPGPARPTVLSLNEEVQASKREAIVERTEPRTMAHRAASSSPPLLLLLLVLVLVLVVALLAFLLSADPDVDPSDGKRRPCLL